MHLYTKNLADMRQNLEGLQDLQGLIAANRFNEILPPYFIMMSKLLYDQLKMLVSFRCLNHIGMVDFIPCTIEKLRFQTTHQNHPNKLLTI